MTDDQPPPARGTVGEVAAYFLRLGFTAFGGPAAHIAMMREALVRRRRWVTEQEFLDLLGATNLIPGPNSTEMAIHLGQVRAGPLGLVAAGVCFIGPAMLIVLTLAWFYGRYGALPQAQWLLYGIKPVIIAVVAQALWGLLKTALKSPALALVGVAALALYLLGLNELVVLFGGAAAGALVQLALTRRKGPPVPAAAVLAAPLGSGTVASPDIFAVSAASVAGVAGAAATAYSAATLFLTFLKIGAVLYGSGYVLLAFLHNDFVTRLGWLTDQQLLDAISIGQFTPGPVFTTATFIGYLLGGWGGALLATVGIFLPSFVFVAAVNPLVPRLRRSRVMGALLDGVNVAALGLMAAVLLQLGQAALVDWLTVAIALIALVLLVRWRVNSVWLILAGAATGFLRHLVLPL
jgi:chromate transporter